MTIITGVFFFLGEALVRPVHTLKLIWDPHLIVWTATGTLFQLLWVASQASRARGGRPAVAELLGGRRVDPDVADADELRLYNVVFRNGHRIRNAPAGSLTSLDRERGINSFAAGTRRR